MLCKYCIKWRTWCRRSLPWLVNWYGSTLSCRQSSSTSFVLTWNYLSAHLNVYTCEISHEFILNRINYLPDFNFNEELMINSILIKSLSIYKHLLWMKIYFQMQKTWSSTNCTLTSWAIQAHLFNAHTTSCILIQ